MTTTTIVIHDPQPEHLEIVPAESLCVFRRYTMRSKNLDLTFEPLNEYLDRNGLRLVAK